MEGRGSSRGVAVDCRGWIRDRAGLARGLIDGHVVDRACVDLRHRRRRVRGGPALDQDRARGYACGRAPLQWLAEEAIDVRPRFHQCRRVPLGNDDRRGGNTRGRVLLDHRRSCTGDRRRSRARSAVSRRVLRRRRGDRRRSSLGDDHRRDARRDARAHALRLQGSYPEGALDRAGHRRGAAPSPGDVGEAGRHRDAGTTVPRAASGRAARVGPGRAIQRRGIKRLFASRA
jgi:hypothetical protein